MKDVDEVQEGVAGRSIDARPAELDHSAATYRSGMRTGITDNLKSVLVVVQPKLSAIDGIQRDTIDDFDKKTIGSI